MNNNAKRIALLCAHNLLTCHAELVALKHKENNLQRSILEIFAVVLRGGTGVLCYY
jgi:hypothetical protein